MSKKSKKKLAKAEALMAEALKMKAEVLRDEALKTGSWNLTAKDNTDAINPITGNASIIPVGKKRLVYFGITGLVILAAILFLSFRYFNSKSSDRDKASNKSSPLKPTETTGIEIIERWHMPDELTEISSNTFIDADRVACVQDNDGIIFTYNLKTKKVENELAFGAKGDYEGLAIVNSIYYVLRGDGLLFEINPSKKGKPTVKQYKLPLELENDTEPMFYDEPNNRLLIGVKEIDPSGGKGKGIYSFDLGTKKMTLDPVYMLTDANDNTAQSPADNESSGKKKGKGQKKDKMSLKPSEIAINYKSGEIYVLNGPKSQLIIADSTGKMKTTFQLDKSVFPQPEGMCFSPSGELYISSEGKKKGEAVIAKIRLPAPTEQ